MNIYFWNQLPIKEQQNLLQRPNFSNTENIKKEAQAIIDLVKSDKDQALFKLIAQYDQVMLNKLKVSQEEFDEAKQMIESDSWKAIEFARTQIEMYHRTQIPNTSIVETCPGIYCERQPRSIERVGLYIPGGSAPLVSTLLMLAIPAQIANCPTRIVCTPPNKNGKINPHILAAAQLCGIEDIFKVGGAQAIAAMAYGTESISKVDKIFGPGNAWVTQAKILISQDVSGTSIDSIAGPSEVMVIADNDANPNYVASDLLSQAEHSVDSQVLLITTSEILAKKVVNALQKQLQSLPKSDVIKQSLSNARIFIVENIEQAIRISNAYAPEHLILQINTAEEYSSSIQNAGAVFLGPWSAETMGDYVTGSNHVLPTYGYARSISGLSLTDFMKYIHFQTITQKGLKKAGYFAAKLAEIEGLEAHKRAVELRLMDLVEFIEN